MQYMSLWIKATAKCVYTKMHFANFPHLYQMIQSFSYIVMLYNEAEERWRPVYMYVCVCVSVCVKAKLIKGQQACVVRSGHSLAMALLSLSRLCVLDHTFF